MSALSIELPLRPEVEPAYVPPVPESLDQAGISQSSIEQLILKHLYVRSDMLGRELSTALGLKFSLIDPTMESFKRQHLIGVKRSLGIGNMSALFSLTEAGRTLAREFMEQNQYSGPAPVPLAHYTEVVRRQKRKESWLTADSLRAAFKHLVVSEDILLKIGPAVNASKSFLIYGQPGNGKTALAESLFRIDDDPIYIPFAIDYNGKIVQMYDPVYHQRIEDAEEELYSALSTERTFDGRFFKCRRPFIVTGGELSLDMLDLSYNPNSKIYDAPFQLKANNGIYLIDDFGRQKASPAEVLNRWIVPMERHVDYLSFQSGGKITVPFEAFLIFSTNLTPEKLGDEAFLRRIQYKMFLRSPDAREFIEIFLRFCASRQLACSPELVGNFIDKHYLPTAKRFRRCHPRDVLSHAIDIIHFERRPYQLTEEVLSKAFESCFTQSVSVND